MRNRELKKQIMSFMFAFVFILQILAPVVASAAPSGNKVSSEKEMKNISKDEFDKLNKVPADKVSNGMDRAGSDEEVDSLDGSNIERITVSWVGAENDKNLRNVYEDNHTKFVRMRTNLSLSGQHDYEVGTVNITIPKQIIRDRNGKYTGKMTVAVPSIPDKSGEFAYTETANYYILTNVRKLKAATSYMFETTINGLTPSKLKDYVTGEVSDPFSARVTVQTHKGNEIAKTSNEITTDFDTKSELASAEKKGYTVREDWPKVWPDSIKPENHEDYVYVEWNMHVNVKDGSNQEFNLNLKDTLTDEYNGQIIGYRINSTNKTYKVDNKRELNEQVFSGYSASSEGYTRVYVKYPKAQFKPNESYRLSNKAEFVLTDKDDNNTTSASNSAYIDYTPKKFTYPEGHFIVVKEGDGDNMVAGKYGKQEGVYSTGLNELREGSNIDLTYIVKSKAFGLKWTHDGGALDNPENYGKIPYSVSTRDYALYFNNEKTKLSASEARFKSIKISKTELYDYVKYDEDGNGYYEDKGGISSGTIYAGDWGYKLNTNIADIPTLHVYGKTENGEFVKYGTFDFSSGTMVVTTENGASVINNDLVFPDGVVEYKIDYETKSAAFLYNIVPTVELKATDRIKGIVEELYKNSDKPETELGNEVDMTLTSKGVDTFINNDKGFNKISGATYGARLEKTLKYTNDVRNKAVTLDYTLSTTIQTNMNQKELNKAIEKGVYLEEKQGTWYDLLPKGVTVDTKTIKMNRFGDNIESVKIIENYRNTGRNLLIVKANLKPYYKMQYAGNSIIGETGVYDNPSLSFKAYYTWTSLSDFGEKLANYAVYESGNEYLGKIKGLKGEPDNPTFGNNKYSKEGIHGLDEDILKNINEDNDNPSYLYANAVETLVVDTAASASFEKLVDVNNEGLYSDGLVNELPKNVYEGGIYTYRLRAQSPATVKLKNVKIFDNLENYKPTNDKDDFDDVTWRGTLQGVDTSSLEAKGVKPVVYYSTVKGLVLDNDSNRTDQDLTDTSKWSTTMPADKSTITAIAVDASKKADGSDFILNKNDSFSVFLKMKAPIANVLANGDEAYKWYDSELKANEKEAGLTGGAHAYNNSVMTSTSIANDGSESSSLMTRHDYTKVGLKEFNIEFAKGFNDGDNRDNKRPNEVRIRLLRNGEDTGLVETLNALNNWKGKFTKLPYVDDDGNLINYTFKEDKVEGYELLVGTPTVIENGLSYQLINIYEPEKVEIKGSKIWLGDDASKRPKFVTLLAKDIEGTILGRVDVYPDRYGNWNYTFNNLYKNEKGVPIKYKIEEVPVDNYITSITTDNSLVTNSYFPYGDLKVEKTVTNVTDVNKDNEFKFTLNLTKHVGVDIMPDTNTYDYIKSNGETGKITSGDTFTLKHNENIVIKNITSTVEYRITEESKDGYETMPYRSSGIILSGKTLEARFNNIYTAEGSFILSGKKTLANSKMKTFQFMFDVFDENGKLIKTGINDKDGNINFGALTYTGKDAGKTHTYTIKERDMGRPGYEYDKHVETFTVTVSDNRDGTLTVTPSFDQDGIVFNNTYTASGSVELKLYKQIAGDFGLKKNKLAQEIKVVGYIHNYMSDPAFGFHIASASYLNPNALEGGSVSEITFKFNNGQTITFGNHDQYGIDLNSWIKSSFDESLKEFVDIKLVDFYDNNKLAKNGFYTQKVNGINHIFDANGNNLTKPLGVSLSDLEEIHIYRSNIDQLDNSPLQKDKMFATITPNKNVISDMASNIMKSISSIFKPHVSNAEESVVTDINYYKFDFELYEIEGNADGPEKDGANYKLKHITPVGRGTNDDKGNVVFSKLNYTQDDIGKVYWYLAKEVKGNIDEVIYDESVVLYKVEVFDNGDGTLSFETKVFDTKTDDAKNDESKPVIMNKFKNGSLAIKKDIKGSGDANTVFDFTITFDKPFEKAPNGVMNVSVKGNESITIEDIPHGIGYKVTETPKEGWALDSAVSDKGIIVANKTKTATFTNEFTPNKVNVNLKVIKDYLNTDGSKLNPAGFDFGLYDSSGSIVERQTVGVNGELIFSSLSFTKEGTYEYHIREIIDSSSKKVNYDTTDAKVIVTVTRENGKLKATTDITDGAIKFTNRIKEYDYSLEKVLNENDVNTEKVFPFEVIINDKKAFDVNLKAGQKHNFKLSYGDDVIVRELNVPKEYASTDIKATHETNVLKEEHNTSSSVREFKFTVGSDNFENNVSLTFKNNYKASGSFDIEVKKVMNGRDLTNREFEFGLYDNTGKLLSKAFNDENGRVRFDAVEINETTPRNTTYAIREIAGTNDGIEYDEHEEVVNVNITDDGEGNLVAKVTYDNDGAVFVNRISDKPKEYDKHGNVSIEKELINITKTNENREFELVVNITKKDGSAIESPFSYTSNKNNDGIIRNGGTLMIKQGEVITIKNLPVDAVVKATENVPEGYELKDSSIIQAEVKENETSSIKLVNQYNPQGRLSLKGVKHLVGDDVNNYKFKFYLLDQDNNLVDEVWSNGSEIAFKEINYGYNDIGKTFVYTIVEEDSKHENILFDKSVKRVEVKVTDDGNGNILTEVKNLDGNIEFTNRYVPSIPKTGNNVLMISALISISAIALISFVIIKRRNEE